MGHVQVAYGPGGPRRVHKNPSGGRESAGSERDFGDIHWMPVAGPHLQPQDRCLEKNGQDPRWRLTEVGRRAFVRGSLSAVELWTKLPPACDSLNLRIPDWVALSRLSPYPCPDPRQANTRYHGYLPDRLPAKDLGRKRRVHQESRSFASRTQKLAPIGNRASLKS